MNPAPDLLEKPVDRVKNSWHYEDVVLIEYKTSPHMFEDYKIIGGCYMNQKILNHHFVTSVYTYAGNYNDYFKNLPDDIPELGNLICSQVIHRVTLKEGNTNANKSLPYGDMTKFPWYRMRCENDILQTAVSMTYAGGLESLRAVIRAVFYDFHAIMNNEISYEFRPSYIAGKFDNL
jgi:hypothetical protein